MNEKQRARINFMKERVVNTIPEMDLVTFEHILFTF